DYLKKTAPSAHQESFAELRKKAKEELKTAFLLALERVHNRIHILGEIRYVRFDVSISSPYHQPMEKWYRQFRKWSEALKSTLKEQTGGNPTQGSCDQLSPGSAN